MNDKSPMSRHDRPQVYVSAVTANSVEVLIGLEAGNVRILAEHGGIYIEANGTKVRVKA